jgi:hypothetical protein
MLHISRSETTISLFQACDRLGRRNNRLVGMCGVSGSGNVASAQESNHDKGTEELRLARAAIYDRIALFIQSESHTSEFNRGVTNF